MRKQNSKTANKERGREVVIRTAKITKKRGGREYPWNESTQEGHFG